MGLVDYSDSDSDSEVPTPAPGRTEAASKKPFQKLVDSSGKIKVNLAPLPGGSNDDDDSRPAKRVKIGGGGGRFSGFSSFLPPPKATATATASKPSAANSASDASSKKTVPARPGVHLNLKTSAEAVFSRSTDDEDDYGDGLGDNSNSHGTGGRAGLSLPAPKAPRIPDGQKPAEEVQLVGKPLMFKPLSVSRKPGKKISKAGTTKATPPAGQAQSNASAPISAPHQSDASTLIQEKKKKFSLFSLGGDDIGPEPAEATSSTYQPLFFAGAEDAQRENGTDEVTGPYDASAGYDLATTATTATTHTNTYAPPPQQAESLGSIADSMNLSAAARRELFGRDRGSGASTAKASKVVNFNIDTEYAHNEALRASGELEGMQHNPVRTVQPGKHSLKQLVNQVHSQREALEETFAKNRANQRESGARYGWR